MNTATQPLSDFARALQRADAVGVTILGSGHYRQSGESFYLVSSSSSTRPHIVRCSGPDIICDCPSRRLCMHVARVRAALAQDAQATAAHMARVSLSGVRESYTRTDATLARVSRSLDATERRETAPLARSNRGISMWAE